MPVLRIAQRIVVLVSVWAGLGQMAVGQTSNSLRSPSPEQPSPAASEKAASGPSGPLDGRDGHDLALDQFRPRAMLKVQEHRLTRARFPVVDVHVHPGFRLHG